MTTPSDPPPPPQSRRTWPWVVASVAGFAFAFVFLLPKARVHLDVLVRSELDGQNDEYLGELTTSVARGTSRTALLYVTLA
jgi:hypothetical protein